MNGNLLAENTKPKKENIIAWFAAGFVLPLASQHYIKESTKKKAGWSVLFFYTFITIVSICITFNIAVDLIKFRGELSTAYETGQFPTIIIQDGVANVSENPTWVFINQKELLLAIDISGDYFKEIDRYKYQQGLLLTEKNLHMYNEGKYYNFPLIVFNRDLDINPIILNQSNVDRLYVIFIACSLLLTFISVWFWYGLVKFMYIVMIGLVFWGITSIFQKGIGFEKILVIGIYSYYTALVFNYLLSVIHIEFLFLETILIIIIWGFHLFFVLKGIESSKELESLSVTNGE